MLQQLSYSVAKDFKEFKKTMINIIPPFESIYIFHSAIALSI